MIKVSADGSFELPDHLDPASWVEITAMGYDPLKVQLKDLRSVSAINLNERVGQLNEIVVSATRTDRSLENLPMPVTIIGKSQIQETGGMRLSEVLREQTGLQVIADHGAGLQMQGLSSDYILILLDGEPLVGRTAGTFDLDRLAVSNIERIEVLRGPSSAIYGSEAMAGVINIITKSSQHVVSANLDARFRSFNTSDVSADLGLTKSDWSVYAYINHYATDGFDLTPEVVGMTQSPFQANTGQVKIGRKSNKWDIKVYSRLYRENSTNAMEVREGSNQRLVDMQGQRNDLNLNPTVSFRPNEHWLLTLRTMSSVFETEMLSLFQEDDSLLDRQDFRQQYHRSELQIDHQLAKKQLLTLGLGHLIESVDATRYDDKNRFDAGYMFLQHQWDPTEKWNLVSGIRADIHSQYGRQVSPKVSAMYAFNGKFRWQASIGAGFKAPDFRQLLLNFNNASSGYYVFGANLVQDGIQRLQSQGLVQQILLEPGQFGALEAETSRAVNTGFRWNIHKDLLFTGNFFLNHITNLIETAPVARLTSGQNAFSYLNVASVVTRGLEVDWNYRLSASLQLSLGYMFLDAQDLDVVAKISNGELFTRDAQNRTRRVTRADYGGLFNRSRHSGNIKVNYREQHTDIHVALRGIYRGRFGFGDLNGNMILDDPSEYARGLTAWNITLHKTLSNGLTLELGGTNLLNQLNTFDPTNPGRTLFAGARIPLHQLVKNN
ncbi:putative TonB dependent outer membrane receptor [Lunatimonas lonarensis]|uniref:Putative TonB dependent outer membrane receptor n=2 Tax=Lunatimonas lonarensis TaxID=1232681 RepID=R7ZTM8_9BACT|nr:putative TonB dependent outer membrane receptor [Lunatimonas lonarensis]